jgi:hypothetical protein
MRLKKIVILAGVLVFATTAQAMALMIAPSPVNQRVATSDIVVVGKVLRLEEKPVAVKQFPTATEKTEYTIAVVQIQEGLLGTDKMKEVRVGFIPQKNLPPVGPNPGPVVRPPIRRYPSVQLEKDQEVCLFLTKHTEGDFYIAPAYFSAIQKNGNPNFAKEVDDARKSAKLLVDPMAGLKAKDSKDRFETAAMLIVRYRTGGIGKQTQEPIQAEESKLILKALADADWDVKVNAPFALTPQSVFSRLGLKNEDGWVPPRDFKQFPEEAKKWLKANGDRYPIQRFVADKSK